MLCCASQCKALRSDTEDCAVRCIAMHRFAVPWTVLCITRRRHALHRVTVDCAVLGGKRARHCPALRGRGLCRAVQCRSLRGEAWLWTVRCCSPQCVAVHCIAEQETVWCCAGHLRGVTSPCDGLCCAMPGIGLQSFAVHHRGVDCGLAFARNSELTMQAVLDHSPCSDSNGSSCPAE